MRFLSEAWNFWNSWTTLGKVVVLAIFLLVLWFLACLPNTIILYGKMEPWREEFQQASRECVPVLRSNGKHHRLYCEGKINAVNCRVINYLCENNAFFIPFWGWKVFVPTGGDGSVKCLTWRPAFCWNPFRRITPPTLLPSALT